MKATLFSLSKVNANILISCRMLDMEHDNKQNEDLQGGAEDKGKEFIKLKVVAQDNLEVHFEVKLTAFLTSEGPTRISEMRNTNCFHKLCQDWTTMVNWC